MRYCVVKNTVTVIDGSLNTESVMLQNASNAGFTAEQVEILTQGEYEARKALNLQQTSEPSELDILRDYVLDIEFRMIMKELEA